MKYYVYGMKSRGFSIGCQPMRGIVEAKDDQTGEYYNLLYYSRRLTDEEVIEYELDYVKEENR